MPADPVLSQNAFGLRFDWGLCGTDAIVDGADVAVVVDVLSFTTTLTVAVDAGIDVIPSRWRGDRATQLAEQFDAVLAVGRSAASPGLISLSRRPYGPRLLRHGWCCRHRTDPPSPTSSRARPRCAWERRSETHRP